MLNELELRRAEFSEGTKVKLGDGQEWTFPKPWLTLWPTRDIEGNFRTAGGMGFGLEYQEKLDEYFEIPEEDIFHRLELQLQLAATILCSNYNLNEKQIRRLLPFDVNNTSNVDMWLAVNQVVDCYPPKPLADGSDSVSLPTV